MELMQSLRESFLFHGLNEGDLQQVAALADIRAVEPGNALWNRLAQDLTLLVVLEGEVELTGMGGQPAGSYGPGSLLGEIGLIDGEPHNVSATASSSGLVAVIQIYDLSSLLIDSTKMKAVVMQNLATLLCERLRQAGVKLYDAGEMAVRQEA